MAAPGSYALLIELSEPTAIEVGALGPIDFEGAYAYAGSAFGPGGLSRVDRHRELAAGDRDVRHWHVDYLLGAPEARLAAVETYPERDVECSLAAAFADAGFDAVDGFGASDCGCGSHLARADGVDELRAVARTVQSEPETESDE